MKQQQKERSFIIGGCNAKFSFSQGFLFPIYHNKRRFSI